MLCLSRWGQIDGGSHTSVHQTGMPSTAMRYNFSALPSITLYTSSFTSIPMLPPLYFAPRSHFHNLHLHTTSPTARGRFYRPKAPHYLPLDPHSLDVSDKARLCQIVACEPLELSCRCSDRVLIYTPPEGCDALFPDCTPPQQLQLYLPTYPPLTLPMPSPHTSTTPMSSSHYPPHIPSTPHTYPHVPSLLTILTCSSMNRTLAYRRGFGLGSYSTSYRVLEASD